VCAATKDEGRMDFVWLTEIVEKRHLTVSAT